MQIQSQKAVPESQMKKDLIQGLRRKQEEERKQFPQQNPSTKVTVNQKFSKGQEFTQKGAVAVARKGSVSSVGLKGIRRQQRQGTVSEGLGFAELGLLGRRNLSELSLGRGK